MKAFISALLGYDPKGEDCEGGILGVVKAHYGCVEAQGRGSLHCHMLVWLEGGLDPNELKRRIVDEGDSVFRDRLLAFLDDSISNAIPTDPGEDVTVMSSEHHPCSVRGETIGKHSTEGDFRRARQKDLHHLVKNCQSHRHTATCYKYWRGPPDPRECRFDLDESHFCPESYIDVENEEICLRCLDGLVNNFNETIIEAIRCNMDIKFIGSGASAKAILYYITDYISKTQLKTHVAFAALELAVQKLGEYNPSEDDFTTRAKRLLQKCAYTMISHQELSAQQVYHFTSHSYRNLHIDKILPSPECRYDRQDDNEGEVSNGNEDLQDREFPLDGEDENSEGIMHSESRDDDDDQHDTENEISAEEVTISVDDDGNVTGKANQVLDYELRGPALDNLCTTWNQKAISSKSDLQSDVWFPFQLVQAYLGGIGHKRDRDIVD
ncbi:hypothetical protein BJ138DRAFT_1137882 [Hygrophoropsis aurantiaca]|uniref:Uncharacterized protein n=1 Tax=Hygrophoropsis aurantiaca TaxID=72124 RepID=A0ACB8A0M8_9AGAM|nr:hypothetical protein BJ138DRAFT_1137882 [Hygrophoropsis aurantiaca]